MNSLVTELATEAASASAGALAVHWSTKIAARLVPGAGWALIGYDAISLGGAAYETLTGAKFSDTKIGAVATKYTDTVDTVGATVGNAAFTGVSAVLSFAGMKSAAQFVSKDARYFVMGETAKPAEGPADAKEIPLARTPQAPVTDRDLPSTDVPPLTAADRAKISAPSDHAETLSLAEATERVDQAAGLISPSRAATSQIRIASLLAADRPPSELDKLAALALSNSHTARPAAPRSNQQGPEIG